MNVIIFFLFYILNFTFYRFTFYFLVNRSGNAVRDGLISISKDFNNIQLPYDLSPNVNFLAILISLFVTISIFFSIKNLFNEELEQLFKNLLLISTLNIAFLFGILYLFKIYNLSRAVLILNIILYPIIYLIFWGINLIFDTRKKGISKKTLLVVGLLASIVLIINLFLIPDQEPINIKYGEVVETDLENIEIEEIVYEQKCSDWAGSNNLIDCIYIEEQRQINLEKVINNIRFFDNETYIVYKIGQINKINLETGLEQEFLDISSRVTYQEYYGGLFDIAFDPNKKFYILSYESNNKLILEKIYYNDINQSEILLEIPEASNETMTLNMSIIYSAYFDDFIVSVGCFNTYVEALNTSSPIGKIFLLNTKPNFNLTAITDFSKNVELNLLAYGLRNAWQIHEYKNLLFMTDVGHSEFEELNILDYEKLSTNISFGWPVFEGVQKYSSYDKHLEELNKLQYWNGKEYLSGEEYIVNNSALPSVYYSHITPNGFLRSAAIGGDIIVDESSKYYEKYFFTDYISKEIFEYDYKNDELIIYPFKNDVKGTITSLRVNPLVDDSLIVSTTAGEIIFLNLP